MGSVVYLLEKDMSKKLLALLVAVSTCCAFGCSDDDSDSCKTGEKRCDGNNVQICVNGNWSKGTPCADGCDEATKACKDGGSGTIPEVGSPCDKSTFQQVCINGGANALVCWDDVVKQWNCANNDCKANTEKPLQVVCAKGDSEPGTTQCNGDPKESGGAVGDCCNKDKYAPDCTGMLRCSNGVIKAISCKDGKSCKLNTDGTCSVESGNYCKDGKYDKTKYPLGYFECV